MALPPNLDDEVGAIEILAGDPYTLKVTIQGQDRTSKIFAAQVRAHRTSPTALAQFSIDRQLVGSDTVLTCTLDGDTAEDPGQTRAIGSRSYFDLQQYSADGEPEQTILRGTLVAVSDVTR